MFKGTAYQPKHPVNLGYVYHRGLMGHIRYLLRSSSIARYNSITRYAKSRTITRCLPYCFKLCAKNIILHNLSVYIHLGYSSLTENTAWTLKLSSSQSLHYCPLNAVLNCPKDNKDVCHREEEQGGIYLVYRNLF